MPSTHFTYQDEPDLYQLRQGDILKKTDDIKKILETVHSHYLKEDYIYFLVLTQSCDLERRSGKNCKAKYITLAAVRPFDLLIDRQIEKLQSRYKLIKGKILDDSDRNKLFDFIRRLLNNNESDYFYLHQDAGMSFPENCVTFLRLSVAIKANVHYESCLKAKTLELRDEFKAKLGWLVGNIYSRVGTDDWTPKTESESIFKKRINDILDRYCFWIDIKQLNKELLRLYTKDEIDRKTPQAIFEVAEKLELLSKKDQLLKRLKELLLTKGYITDDTIIDKLILSIKNDPEIKAIIK